MRVLGIDTALKACSVAIVENGETRAVRSAALEKGHAERLAPMVVEVFADAGLAARDIDRIGVVVGPGGFAGVRVGLSFARAFALAAGCAAVGVTSLAALVATAGRPGLVAPVIDARRGQVYVGLYDAEEMLVEPFVAAPEEALARLSARAGGALFDLIGDGAPLLAAQAPDLLVADATMAIDPAAVARLAAATAPDGPPRPVYLRAPDARPGAPSAFASLLRNGAP